MEKPLCVALRNLLPLMKRRKTARRKSWSALIVVSRHRSQQCRNFCSPPRPDEYALSRQCGCNTAGKLDTRPRAGWKDYRRGCAILLIVCGLSVGKPSRASLCRRISQPTQKAQRRDTVNISLKFADGSIGTVQYLANGDSAVPKEYCEVFADGKTAQMHNFEALDLAQGRKISRSKFDGTKDISKEMSALIQAVKSGRTFPIDTKFFAPLRLLPLRQKNRLGVVCP